MKKFKTVYELLKDKSMWTRKVCARGKGGQEVWTASPSAVSFCFVGAYFRVYGCKMPPSLKKAILDRTNGLGAVYYNDAPSTTHSDIVKLAKELGI